MFQFEFMMLMFLKEIKEFIHLVSNMPDLVSESKHSVWLDNSLTAKLNFYYIVFLLIENCKYRQFY